MEFSGIYPINYSCHLTEFREGEQFAAYHSLGIVVSGTMELNDGQERIPLTKGEFWSSRKNHLVKFYKKPSEDDAFKSISIRFDEQLLRDFSLEYGYKSEEKVKAAAFIKLPPDPSMLSFVESLKAYEHLPQDEGALAVLQLKQKEALLILLRQDPGLKNILFDFTDPERINLEAFMEKNFHFNVQLERFAYLTGRSLSTFKRDFEKIFDTTPSRWLLQRRLKEAHYLIAEKGKFASDIYLDLGFEDLSHFSFTFKKQFGTAPSKIHGQ